MTAIKQGLVGAYVNAMGQEALVAPITPGSVFETRLNRTIPSVITYRALAPTRLLKLSEERFQEFLQNPEFANWCSTNQYRNFTMLTRIGAAAAQKNTDRKILVFVSGYLEILLQPSAGGCGNGRVAADPVACVGHIGDHPHPPQCEAQHAGQAGHHGDPAQADRLAPSPEPDGGLRLHPHDKAGGFAAGLRIRECGRSFLIPNDVLTRPAF